MSRTTRRRRFTPVVDALGSRIAPGGIVFEPLPVTIYDNVLLSEEIRNEEDPYDPMEPHTIGITEPAPEPPSWKFPSLEDLIPISLLTW